MLSIVSFDGILMLLVPIALFYVFKSLRTHFQTKATHAKLEKAAKDKRKQRDAIIAAEYATIKGLPDEATQTLILNSSVPQLIQLLNQDKVTSEQLVKLFFARSVTIGLRCEWIADSNYPEAIELARACDLKRSQTKSEDRPALGELFGIPISIKDSFFQKGFPNTRGCAAACFEISPEDGEIIKRLKSQGAIPFIRSSTPQAMQVFDCTNAFWGTALNPWDLKRSTSGSSGGEGGLVAAKCSPLGLGSDLRCSIRMPAAFCGIAGFKPTKWRIISKGHAFMRFMAISKFSALNESFGPMAKTVDDLVVLIKALIAEEVKVLNPAVQYQPWDETKYQTKAKLRIGYCVSEKIFGATKSVQRAVRESVAGLKALGHEVVETQIPGFERMSLLMLFVMTNEGKGKELYLKLRGEKPIRAGELELMLRTLPTPLKKVLTGYLKVMGYKRLANMMEMLHERSVYDYHCTLQELYTLRDELLAFFVKNKFDAFVLPTMPAPAPYLGNTLDYTLSPCYTWPANFANLPAGSVPVTYVQEGEEVYDIEDCVYEDFISQTTRRSMKGSKGMPISVQVMSLPWEDEKCLAVLKAIESQANFKDLPIISI